MRVSSSTRRRIRASGGRVVVRTAALVAAVSMLSGCIVESGRSEQSRSIGASTPCPVEPDESVTGTVRIGWQEIPNGDLVVKDTGLLAACLPNVTVEWAKFSSGGDVVQAFGADSLDVGLLGSAPATKALSAPLNIDMDVIWIQDRIGAAESLVADPAITTVRPTDLTIEPGEFVSIVGPSGCGKTTLLRLIAGFEKPTSGTVRVGEQTVTAPASDRGVVFQAPTLYPWLTVRGNVEFGLKVSGVGKTERRERARRMLDLVGLGDFGDKRPYELSGGMQQRAQIARVLVNDPAIVLMDEPYGALDALTRERLQSELLALWRETGKTIVFITHSVDEAVFLSTRVLVMSPRPGRIVIDRPIVLPDDRPDGVRGREVTATAEFAELRTELAAAIYAARD